MIAEQKIDQITKLLIDSTNNCLIDPHKVLYTVGKAYMLRSKFVDWNRILDIVKRHLLTLDFDAVSLELYYDRKEGNLNE